MPPELVLKLACFQGNLQQLKIAFSGAELCFSSLLLSNLRAGECFLLFSQVFCILELLMS